MLARLYSKSFKLGFSSLWTKNFHMYKLGFKDVQELEIKLSTSVGWWRKQGNSRKKTSTLVFGYAKTFDCVDHNKLKNS